MAIVELLASQGIERTTNLFRAELVRTADRLDMNPSFIGVVMSLESGFNPQARNPSSKATGLIQFMPETARRLGTTVDALLRMTDVQQLSFVEKFYSRYAGKLSDPGQYYMATFLPKHVGAPPDRILSSAGEAIYDQNKGLDRNRDGILTAGDVYSVAESRAKSAEARPRIMVDMNETPAIGSKSSDGEFINTGNSAGIEMLVAIGAVWVINRYVK